MFNYWSSVYLASLCDLTRAWLTRRLPTLASLAMHQLYQKSLDRLRLRSSWIQWRWPTEWSHIENKVFTLIKQDETVYKVPSEWNQFISPSFLLQQPLNNLHPFKHLLFFQPPSNNLNAQGQTMHIICIIHRILSGLYGIGGLETFG